MKMEDRGMKIAIFDFPSSILDLLSFLIDGCDIGRFRSVCFHENVF